MRQWFPAVVQLRVERQKLFLIITDEQGAEVAMIAAREADTQALLAGVAVDARFSSAPLAAAPPVQDPALAALAAASPEAQLHAMAAATGRTDFLPGHESDDNDGDDDLGDPGLD